MKEAANRIELSLPKIPASIFGVAVRFFRLVFERYGSEACLLLMFSKDTNEFRLWCPTQNVFSRAVDYDRSDFAVRRQQEWGHHVEHEQWLMIGSLHSHGASPAFHSFDDRKDNATFDGIHVTVGHLSGDQLSMAVAAVMNGFHVFVRPADCFLGVEPIETVVDENWPEAATDAVFVRMCLSEPDAKLVEEIAQRLDHMWLSKVRPMCPSQ